MSVISLGEDVYPMSPPRDMVPDLFLPSGVERIYYSCFRSYGPGNAFPVHTCGGVSSNNKAIVGATSYWAIFSAI